LVPKKEGTPRGSGLNYEKYTGKKYVAGRWKKVSRVFTVRNRGQIKSEVVRKKKKKKKIPGPKKTCEKKIQGCVSQE